ncbi:putative ABC transport system ATP-binding protein [Microvirgula sp. AG722]|nr:putative ABC transport system ATP-binding protein [Microvirgula sp. AG722]
MRASGLSRQVELGAETLTLLSGLDLDVEAGDTLAIVGRSGSGKSTLLALLAGLDLPTAGDVWLAGESLTGLSEDGRARLRQRAVGFVFQNFQLLPALTALENVMLPLELAGRRDAREQAAALLERVGLADRQRHRPRELSGGEQQRVALARAFVAEPAVLFADEPTGNLDADTGAMITDLLFELNRERGTTLILVTHDDTLAARCRRVVRLDHGRLHEETREAA